MNKAIRRALNLVALLLALASAPLVQAQTSNAIQVTASLVYTNLPQNISAQTLAAGPSLFTITGINYAGGTMAVPTTSGGTVIPLGSVTTLGWAMLKNNDATNYVDVLVAVSGTDILRLYPGEVALFRFGSGISAPAAIAHTATVLLQYLILAP